MKLTRKQLENLLERAYGFVCKYSTFMTVSEKTEDTFTLENADAEYATYTYNDAVLDLEDGVIVLDSIERFTIVVKPLWSEETCLSLLGDEQEG